MRRTIIAAAILFTSTLGFAQHTIEPAFPLLEFERPVDLQHAGDASNRLFVVEQTGRILVFENDPKTPSSRTFLDIRDRVGGSRGEEGLLGLAFHPHYAQNGRFFVYYSVGGTNNCAGTGSSRCSRVSSFVVSGADSNAADVGSETVILQVGQPFSNHNGGQLRFGPDGFLYIALGDGGSGGDPRGHGQNRSTLLGSLLRIDVDNPVDGKSYGVPPDNPFVGTQFREEIYAYGLRNPWRFSFDSATGDLWLGDVGQNTLEEVDIVVKGGNYGWNIMEGNRCFSPPSGCQQVGLELPVWTYGHGTSGGRSITGGFVYRGNRLAGLQGTYVYGDFTSGRIWGLISNGDGTYTNELITASNLSIAAFGSDQEEELYICTFEGSIYKFDASDSTGSSGDAPATALKLEASFPNPVSSTATILFTTSTAGYLTLSVFDSIGRLVSVLFEGHVSAGRHSLVVSSDALAPGTYFYQLRTLSGSTTRRMVVL